MPCSRISILLYCPQQTTFASDTCSSYCCHPTLSFTAYLTASNKVSPSNAPQLAAALYCTQRFEMRNFITLGNCPVLHCSQYYCLPPDSPASDYFFYLLLGFQSLNFLTTTIAFVDLCVLLGVQSPHSLLPTGMLGLYHKNSL